MYEIDSVDAQVKIQTDNFLLALDSCASFETKLIKRLPAGWMTEAKKIKSRRKKFSVMNTNQLCTMMPDCRRKKNINNKKLSFVCSLINQKSSNIMKH